jgi:hypothetical protein
MNALRGLLAAWRGDRFAHAFLLLLPAIQYGFNYFASVAAVLFLLTAWHTRLRIVPAAGALVLLAAGASLLFCAVGLPDEPNLPREARFTMGLLFLFFALRGTPRHAAHRFDGRFALAMLILLFLVTALQWFASKKGIALFPPRQLFVNPDDQALASTWVEHAKEHGYAWSLRPAAFFSEPSYLGCMTLFLHFLCLHTLRGRQRWLALIVALATCLLAQTYFGLTGNLAILGAFYARRLPKAFALAAGVLALSVSALAIGTGALPSSATQSAGRLERIVSGDDPSVTIRLTQPFELLGQVLAHAPLGVPMSAAQSYFERHRLIVPFEDAPLQNGAFNLVFAYGWLAIPLFVLLWRAAGGGLTALFMLLLLAQNGAPLNFDKLTMIVFAIQIARQARYRPVRSPSAPLVAVRAATPPAYTAYPAIPTGRPALRASEA